MNETPFLHLMELEIENTLCTRVSEKMRQHPTLEAGHCVYLLALGRSDHREDQVLEEASRALASFVD